MEDRVEVDTYSKANLNLQQLVDTRMKEIAIYCFNLNIIEIVCSNSLKSAKYILSSPAVKASLLP